MASVTFPNTATVQSNTTLRKTASVSGVSLGVMKKGDKVTVYWYGESAWFCKCKHPKYGTGFAIFFTNGNVHISGPGVTDAIKNMGGKIGDSSTGYQTNVNTNKKVEGTGTTKNEITVRKSASSTSSVVGKIPSGTSVTMKYINPVSGWCYVSGKGLKAGSKQNTTISGYTQYKTSSKTNIKCDKLTTSGGYTLTEINANKGTTSSSSSGGSSDSSSGGTSDETSAESEGIGNDDILGDEAKIDYSAFSDKFSTYTTAAAYVKSVRGIYGMPYQFMSSVDPRLDDGLYGRFYAERILAKMPLLILSPGKPKYMPDFTKEENKQDLIKALADLGLSGLNKVMNDILNADNTGGKFYTFEHAYNEYFEYLNPMCQQLAIYLGLDNVSVPLSGGGYGKLYTMNWSKFQNSYINESVSQRIAVGFYVDSETQISETFTNSTAESQFASSVNQVNDLSREIQFLMGGATGESFNQLMGDNFDSAWQEIEQFARKFSQVLPGLLTNRLKNTFDTIKVGGQLIFPEIWNDSEAGRDYNIKIKLRSPDGDNFSWYMNIGVPMMHLLAFVLPKRLGYNGIQSPFLVRGYYKSFFNVDMGIITNMTISRGDKCKWNLSGMPLDVDIDFTIKDLYQSLSIESVNNFKANTSQLDYIANLCGININKPDLLRSIILGYNDKKLKALTYLTDNNFLGVHQAIDNYAMHIYSSFFK